MPIAPWLTAEQNTNMPAPLASLWDFIRRDPFGGMTVSPQTVRSGMSQLIPAMSREGGYQFLTPRLIQLLGLTPRAIKPLESPMTELPSFLSRIISTGSSDINAPQIVANMMKTSSGVDHYLSLLHQRLQRPNPIEDQYFNALIHRYMARNLP